MSDFVLGICIFAIAFGGLGFWLYWNSAANRLGRGGERSAFERPDHHRAHEMAKAEAELSRWSGPQG